MSNNLIKNSNIELDEASAIFRKKIEELKNLEDKLGKPLKSDDIVKSLGEVEEVIADNYAKRVIEGLSKRIDATLTAFNDPINIHTNQIKTLREAYEKLEVMIKIAIGTAKTVGWIIGGLLTLFTIAQYLKNIIMR